MPRPLSLAWRLTLLFGTAGVIVFSSFGWFIFESTESHFALEDTEEIDAIASAVQEVLVESRWTTDFEFLQQRFGDILVGHHQAALYVSDPEGRVIYSSSSPDLSKISVGDRPFQQQRWKDEGRNFRVRFQKLDRDGLGSQAGYRVVVAVPIDHHLRFFSDFKRSLWFLIACSIATMSIMSWLAIRQGHAPLRDMVDRIKQISASELGTRLPPEAVPGELTELAVSFNDLLGRVDEAFRRLSNFNADIAHEMRTPIANLMMQTEVALSQLRSKTEYREILYSNAEEYERISQMVDDMLFLAQAEGIQIRTSVEVDLSREVQALFEFYEGWAEEQEVALELTGAATTTGDRLMLQRALSNLLSNAIRHTSVGGVVEVRLDTTEENGVSIQVRNPGEDVPPEHLPNLFDRFYRVDQARRRGESGAGLGLAIVASIIKAHDGRIEVTSRDGITTFTIVLPGGVSR